MKGESREYRILFALGLVFAAGFAGVFLLFWLRRDLVYAFISSYDCLFRRLTGLYCPGCGGTRALFSLFRGELKKSFFCHPIVLTGLLYYLCFMLSRPLSRLTKGRVRPLPVRNGDLIGLGALLVLQWVIKNLLLLAGHPIVY